MAVGNFRNPYVWNLAVAVAGVYLEQATVGFPLTNKASQSKIVTVGLNTGKTGLGLTLLPPKVIDWWSWEYACWPTLAEFEGRNDLPLLFQLDGIRAAEFFYDELYGRLVTLGKVPPQP